MGTPTSLPIVDISLLPAAQVTAYSGRRDIIFGQTGASGTAVAGALNINVEAMTTAEVRTLFGNDSYLTKCIQQWKSSNGGYSLLDVVSLDESGTGVAATGVIAFTGGAGATSDGTYYISIVDETEQVEVAVTSGDSITTIGDALVAAIATLTYPVYSAVNGAGTVTCTAKDKGTIPNDFGIKVEGTVPGITVTITGWTGGANDPVLTSILDNIDGIRYTGMLWPQAWYGSISIPKTELETRFNASNSLMDGTCFTGMTDTYADILTALSTENSKCIVTMGCGVLDTATHKGPTILKPADWAAAEFMGIRARRNTPDAPIADFVVSTDASKDTIGGAHLASKPYFNTPLANTPVTLSTNLFSETEQAALKAAGFTVYGVNDAQNGMLMGPVVTNWVTDDAGNANTSFKYLNYVDTGSACREVFFSVLKAAYSQSRLTEGDLLEGISMTNAEALKAMALRIYRSLSDEALTQKGAVAEAYFADNTSITVSLVDRSATMAGPLPIVTQLESITYPLQLAFTTESVGMQITI